MAVSEAMVERLDEDMNFVDKIITREKTWIFQYDPETKRQSGTRTNFRNRCFVCARGLVHREFVLTGQTFNGRLKDHVRRVRSGIIDVWIIYHESARLFDEVPQAYSGCL